MAGRTEIPIQLLDPVSGSAISGAAATIRNRENGSLATVYLDEASAVQGTNPIVSDSWGRVNGWLNEGRYVAEISGGGLVPRQEPFDSSPARSVTGAVPVVATLPALADAAAGTEVEYRPAALGSANGWLMRCLRPGVWVALSGQLFESTPARNPTITVNAGASFAMLLSPQPSPLLPAQKGRWSYAYTTSIGGAGIPLNAPLIVRSGNWLQYRRCIDAADQSNMSFNLDGCWYDHDPVADPPADGLRNLTLRNKHTAQVVCSVGADTRLHYRPLTLLVS